MRNNEDSDFIAIQARNFVSGSQSKFDLFVRLSSGKFLKILRAGESFSPDRLQNYINNGVHEFHIRKDAEAAFRELTDKLGRAVVASETLAPEVKAAHTLRHGDMVMDFLKSQGVSQENLNYATQFVGNVRTLAGELRKATRSEVLTRFLNDAAAADHGTAVSMLSAILCQVLEIRMEKPVQIVGISALFHDIGLVELSDSPGKEVFLLEEEAKLDEAQLKVYKTHPKIGADLLRGIRGIEPAAIQGIEQHHMRMQGNKGFPERNFRAPLSRVAEIVGICDEFHRLIVKSGSNLSNLVLTDLELLVFPYFSKQIIYAFRTAFFSKRESSDSAA